MKDNRMKNAAKYYQVYNFMTSLLGLRGNERSVYAIIYGYTRDGYSDFGATREYLANTASCSVITVARALADLVRKGHLLKADATRPRYAANLEELRIYIDDAVLKKVGKYTDKSSVPREDIRHHIETLSVSDCYRINSKLTHNNKDKKLTNTPSSSSARDRKSVSGDVIPFPEFTGDPRNAPKGTYDIMKCGHTGQIFMTAQQYLKLMSLFGEELLEKYIDKLEIDMVMHGREPHSAFATLLKWAAEDYGVLPKNGKWK